MPNPSVIFHTEDWFMIPFSLLWGSFTLFWVVEVTGIWGGKSGPVHIWQISTLWGAAFALMGQYFIWGRFISDAWLKRRTYYAVTNRRILFLQLSYKRKSRVVYLDTLTEISHEGSTTGRIWLGPRVMFGSSSQRQSSSTVSISGSIPVLADIDDVDAVYHLIQDLRQKTFPSKREF